VINSTISGNMGSGEGGGIYNVGGTTITNSTISDNLVSGNVGQGGGIENNGVLTITNSTISGNVATDVGGGVSNFGYFTATNSTFSGNSATDGGGIYISGLQETNAQIGDSVLNAGASGGTIRGYSGNLTSLGYNLASDDGGGFLTGPGDQINTDPMLGPLQDNGGPTFTHALLPGSPAIDAGDPSFTPPPFYDQRGPGFDRVVDGRIDIGSFEVQGPTPTPTPTATPRHSPLPRPRPTPPPRQ
jgi:predicted outer membrane repeat protein